MLKETNIVICLDGIVMNLLGLFSKMLEAKIGLKSITTCIMWLIRFRKPCCMDVVPICGVVV